MGKINTAQALVDYACEQTMSGNWMFDEFEIEDILGFRPTAEDMETIAEKVFEDDRVADVDYYPIKDFADGVTWYLDITLFWDVCNATEDDYSSNMPCDNFGMLACSSSCPKFYECN